MRNCGGCSGTADARWQRRPSKSVSWYRLFEGLLRRHHGQFPEMPNTRRKTRNRRAQMEADQAEKAELQQKIHELSQKVHSRPGTNKPPVARTCGPSWDWNCICGHYNHAGRIVCHRTACTHTRKDGVTVVGSYSGRPATSPQATQARQQQAHTLGLPSAYAQTHQVQHQQRAPQQQQQRQVQQQA